MRLTTLALAGSVAAFGQVQAQTLAPTEVTPVSASAGRTWDAVVDAFASRGIPIRTMERASGLIATDQVVVSRKQALQWAECGRRTFRHFPYDADRAIYNVFVRGDSAASTVDVTVRWTHGGVPGDPVLLECNTKNVRESELEAAIKLGAETVVPRGATLVSASAGRTWDAVVDVFAVHGIPICTMERANGFIATDPLGVYGKHARRWADCGRLFGATFTADRATYNVFVRGDSATSTVKVTVCWTLGGVTKDDSQLVECSTRNVRESELEAAIKLGAETVVPRDATPVGASASRTWDAVVDVLASRTIPIRTMERASGFIVTDQVAVNLKQAQQWATDCGTSHLIVPLDADRAIYTVLVRGDSAASTVDVTARWTQGGVPDDPQIMECSTRNVRENELEAAIKLGAETVVPRDATPVSASAGRTWDAVVDVFASRAIPIRKLDRANGFVATDPLGVGRLDGRRWANCGRMLGTTFDPDRATYNVIVRGDSAASTVKVTVRWTRDKDPEVMECSTKNVRESELEAAIKLGAEAH